MNFSTDRLITSLLRVETLSLEETNLKRWQQKMLFTPKNYEFGYIQYEYRSEDQHLGMKWDRDN